jgi:ABC-type sugar transport system ATPase subunit/ribose/xylose/arabinose/galactoside ABC-type transport system permease subunit
VVALDDVDFDLRSGEVHGLVGENGAGKSTLINLVSGVLQPDAGVIHLAGEPVRIPDPVAARRLGVVTVHQEADFFPSLSVAENMALLSGLPTGSFGLVDWTTVNRSAQESVNAVGEEIRVSQSASQLSVAHRHMTQIAAAVVQRAKVVILDEPTSALTAVESAWLFEQIERLTAAGAGVVYISHRQEEILALADRVTVLRDGRKVWTRTKSEITNESLITAMVGRDAGESPRAAPSHTDEVQLHVAGLSDLAGRFSNVSFELRAGEVVGVYGLVGAGRTELAEALYGLRPVASGSVTIGGVALDAKEPARAVAAGLAYLPEDRLRQGLFRGLSIRANSVVSTLQRWSRCGLFTNAAAENAATESMTGRLAVKHRSIQQPISQLSGGNQQKVVLGRCLLAEPRVLILDEPTRGVDVGAKTEIHQLLRQIAANGCAILMISSELHEVIEQSDRILVMREGALAGEFDATAAEPEEIAQAALPAEHGSRQETGGADHSERPKLKLPFGELGLALIVIVLLLWLGLTSDNFFSANNLANLASETGLWTILGLAAATVIVAGGIDISVGSLIAVAAASAGLILKTDLPPGLSIPLAVASAVAVGSSGGLLNGALSLVGRIHPIVVTLGMIFFYRGIAIALLRGQQINELPQQFGYLAIHPASGFRGVILIGAVVTVSLYVVLSHTRFGRHLYALGSSESAARLVGISKTKVWLGAFAASGLLVGLAAAIELASSMQMQAQLAKGWELQAIAVAVIGGVSITGGRGTVLGVFLGALLLQLVNSALVRWEIQGSQVDLVVGGMILTAVVLDLVWRKLER